MLSNAERNRDEQRRKWKGRESRTWTLRKRMRRERKGSNGKNES